MAVLVPTILCCVCRSHSIDRRTYGHCAPRDQYGDVAEVRSGGGDRGSAVFWSRLSGKKNPIG